MAIDSDLLSVAEAADQLGVVPARVRAMLADGLLEGKKIGGRWLVDGRSVRARERRPGQRGRRLRAGNAWAILALASGGEAPWVSNEERQRLERLLNERGLARLVGRLGERAEVKGFYGHPGVLQQIRDDERAVPAGAHAQRSHGERLVPGDDVDVYVDANALASLVEEHALEPSDAPNVVIRVLPDGLWPFNDRRVPLAAVAVDLVEMPDARARRVGWQIIERNDLGANRGSSRAPSVEQ